MSTQIYSLKEEIIKGILEGITLYNRNQLKDYLRHILETFPGGIFAVIFYGSKLFDPELSKKSFCDFFIIVDRLKNFYQNQPIQRLLNNILPPNIYFEEFEDSKKERLRCKYSVISRSQLKRETSYLAKDIYHAGRFSKRIALAYTSNESAKWEIATRCLEAILFLTPFALARLKEKFGLEEFIYELLSLSYIGETRVVEPQKPRRIFERDKEYYIKIYKEILDWYAITTKEILKVEDRYKIVWNLAEKRMWERRLNLFLYQSRLRGKMRWPKYMFTVKDWQNIIVEKLSRYHGLEIRLSPWERRFPYIFGWRHYLELKKKGIVKSLL